MPGLAELRVVQVGELTVTYLELSNGGRIDYTSKKPELIEAIHRWFNAQFSDHERHAVSGMNITTCRAVISNRGDSSYQLPCRIKNKV